MTQQCPWTSLGVRVEVSCLKFSADRVHLVQWWALLH